jgi:hypothetical protein
VEPNLEPPDSGKSRCTAQEHEEEARPRNGHPERSEGSKEGLMADEPAARIRDLSTFSESIEYFLVSIRLIRVHIPLT